MKFISNFKLFFSLIVISIMLSSLTSKTNLRSKTRIYEPLSYTPKEMQYVRDFDDFGDKIEHVQNTGYIDILRLGAGIKNPHYNMRSNVQKAPSPFRFVQKSRNSNRQDNEDIPMADLQNPSTSSYSYKGVN